MTYLRTWTLPSEMAMAEAFVHPWDATGQRSACSRTRSRDSHRISRNLRIILALGFLALALVVLGPSRPAGAAAPDSAGGKVAPQGLLDFEACARLAIQQSPYLTKSSVEIEIRRLDENDSRYSMVPPLTLRTYYYVNRPDQPGLNPTPYSLSFNIDPYNPLGSYFTLQAQKMATQMAILGHVQLISEGLLRLGRIFLKLAALKRLALYQDDLVKLSRENLTYAENRQSIGTGTSLEVRLASQELELAKSEKDRLETTRKRTLTSLKTFLGLKTEQPVDLDLRNARRQVMGSFNPEAATLEQAKARSYELKVLELKKEMQGYNIALAKAKIMPTILFTTQTPDPLSVTTARGLYVGLGLEVPIWDGFKRVRDVSRQKAVLKQFGADKDLKEIDLIDKWNALQEDLKSTAAALKISRSQGELALLKERQSEIRYQSAAAPLPTWLEGRKANLEAQKNMDNKALQYDELVLYLRNLSGDLGNSYVDQNSWKK